MKNSIKTYVCFIIGAFIILLASCSQSPADKQLDAMEAYYNKMLQINGEPNPSDEEILNLRKAAIKFGASTATMAKSSELQDIKMTATQKMRALDLMTKMEALDGSPSFQPIKRRLRSYNLNY